MEYDGNRPVTFGINWWWWLHSSSNSSETVIRRRHYTPPPSTFLTPSSIWNWPFLTANILAFGVGVFLLLQKIDSKFFLAAHRFGCSCHAMLSLSLSPASSSSAYTFFCFISVASALMRMSTSMSEAHIVPLNWVWHYNEMSNNIIINERYKKTRIIRVATLFFHRHISMLMDTFFCAAVPLFSLQFYTGIRRKMSGKKCESKKGDMKWKLHEKQTEWLNK